MNQQLFYWINGAGTPWLDALMRLAGTVGDPLHVAGPLLAAAALRLVWRFRPERAAAWGLPEPARLARFLKAGLLAVISLTLLVSLLKWGFDQPRPSVALPEGSVRLLLVPGSPYSFPSGHAAFAMLTACVLWPCCRGGGRLALVLWVLWVGLARISVGAHFPGDVLAGWCCGALCARLPAFLLPRLDRSGSRPA